MIINKIKKDININPIFCELKYFLNNAKHNYVGPSYIHWDKDYRLSVINYHKNGMLHKYNKPVCKQWYNGQIIYIIYRIYTILFKETGISLIIWYPNGQLKIIRYPYGHKLYRKYGPNSILWDRRGYLEYLEYFNDGKLFRNRDRGLNYEITIV